MSLYIIFYLQPIDEVLIELFNENITSEISLVKYYFCNHCNLYSQLVNLQFQDGHVYKMRKLKFFWSKPTLLKTAWGYLKIEKQLSWTNIIWLWSKPPPPHWFIRQISGKSVQSLSFLRGHKFCLFVLKLMPLINNNYYLTAWAKFFHTTFYHQHWLVCQFKAQSMVILFHCRGRVWAKTSKNCVPLKTS